MTKHTPSTILYIILINLYCIISISCDTNLIVEENDVINGAGSSVELISSPLLNTFVSSSSDEADDVFVSSSSSSSNEGNSSAYSSLSEACVEDCILSSSIPLENQSSYEDRRNSSELLTSSSSEVEYVHEPFYYFYDDKPTVKQYFSVDDSLMSYITYAYDKHGNVIKEESWQHIAQSKFLSLSSHSLYEYDITGELKIKYRRYDGGDSSTAPSLLITEYYRYDADNRIDSVISYFQNQEEIDGVITYEYLQDTLKIREHVLLSGSEHCRTYAHDSDGLSSKAFIGCDTLQLTGEFSYGPGNDTTVVGYNPMTGEQGVTIRATYEGDAIQEELFHYPDGSQRHRYEFLYDSSGLLYRVNFYNESDEMYKYGLIHYETPT